MWTVNAAIMQWSEFQYCCVAQLILVFCGCFEDSSWGWFLCSYKSIVKSIGIEYCNTFVKKYWYCYCQYFFAQVVVLVLAILLGSIVNKPACLMQISLCHLLFIQHSYKHEILCDRYRFPQKITFMSTMRLLIIHSQGQIEGILPKQGYVHSTRFWNISVQSFDKHFSSSVNR